VRAAQPASWVLGDAEDRDAQPGRELKRTRHRNGGGRGPPKWGVAHGLRERRESRAGACLQRSASRPDSHRRCGEIGEPLKLRQITAFGADVRLEGEDIEDARLLARELAAADRAYLVEDSLDLVTCGGAATIGLEFARDDPGLDVVLVALGGGAMASGVAYAVHSLAEHVEVIGIQPVGAPAMALSWRQRTVVETDFIETIADGVAGRCPIPEVLEDLLVVLDDVMLVREDSIKTAMRMLYEHTGLVVEPSAALGVAAVLEEPERFAGRRVSTILCGSNLSPADFARWVLEPLAR
jgi:threonine dehydratase